MTQTKPYGTVLIKAAKLIDYLADYPDQSLQEIAEATNLTASTTIKILDTLVLIGYVQKSLNKTYRLGAKLIRYANQSFNQMELSKLTLPHLEKMQKTIDETIHLGILDNNEILYINKLDPKNQSIRMSSKIGITRPLYNSAMGKAVLAEFSPEELENYLQMNSFIPFTENTITNPLRLAKELEKVRQAGIAYDDEEVERDIFCCGTALKKNQQIIGAFSISMPKYRLTPEKKEIINHSLLETKRAIEKNLI